MRTITEKHTFDKFYYTEVSNGEKTITVWPGPDYPEKLEEAKKILRAEIVDYKLKLIEAIKPVYDEAKTEGNNLQFFEDLKFLCENSNDLIEIGHQRMRGQNG